MTIKLYGGGDQASSPAQRSPAEEVREEVSEKLEIKASELETPGVHENKASQNLSGVFATNSPNSVPSHLEPPSPSRC